MTVKYGKFELPQKIKIEEGASPSHAVFVLEPFERGYGHTIGNTIRRMTLTSMEAPAIISVRFEGVPHEYMAVEGIVEDMTNIILNLKGALLRKLPLEESTSSRDNRIITSIIEVSQGDLDKNEGQYEVTLGDIVKDGGYDVINPSLHLFTITKPMKKQIDLKVMNGRGYVPSERHHIKDRLTDEIVIDSSFSPVRLVNYFVENTRVGQDTDYDRLILEITTDGRVTPIEAVTFAAQIATKHFDVFQKLKTHPLHFEEGIGEGETDEDEMMEKLALKIDEIELSVRSTNCLSGANIETIAELVSIPERKMLEFRNFGKKSLNEIKAKLTEMNLHLGMDLSRFGITSENVKDKMKDFYREREKKKGREQVAKDEEEEIEE